MLKAVCYRGLRMKHYDLKRALLIFSLFCIAFFVVLFWQQNSAIDEVSQLFPVYKKSPLLKKERKLPYPPQWHWQCNGKHCERQKVAPGVSAVSLSTCSMLCGSTQLWPQPSGPVTLGSKTATFNHHQIQFKADAKEPAATLLNHAIEIFKDKVLDYVQDVNYTVHDTDVEKILVHLKVQHADVVRLRLDTDESYHLTIKSKAHQLSVNITANTFFGVRHGLETLSQLIWWDEYSKGGMLRIIKNASVKDYPVFSYRGLMLDTARNYMSVDTLKRVFIGMSANKLNIFHWHVSDSQSFPLILPRLPKFAKVGSYAPDMTYSPEDVKELMLFALVRGIRIVIEIDTPAHAGSGWTWGPDEDMGELAVCVNKQPWMLYCGEPPCGQLNPDNPKVYEVLETLYKDLLDMTKEDELFHIGGDEVNLECWQDSLSSATQKKYGDFHDLWGDFTLKALESLQKANGGKRIPYVLVWSSNLTKRPYVSKYFNRSNIVVQSWGSSQWPDTLDLIQDGYKVIISHVDAWYLDCGFGRWRETGDAACDPYRTWQTVYNHRPWTQQGVNKKQVMGGEICLWSEQVDETSVDARLWPRGAAFAERMWSDPSLDLNTFSISEDVYLRLNTQRDRLVARGLRPEAMWPQWCLQNPGMCL
ncbi:probable beta-hexosaminidase fdl isoform X1 [Harmonia axyridis]|uniref:probable beta-hexosaminidase fdl isoform X1 n=2 Tax=Harmonia axyridis TaxID=115357 RepID=UPI001E278E56|nr:probable beta-hexosaminidase fdl isoform X1 [Harmonia axyridis]